jgi:hypothetical protein
MAEANPTVRTIAIDLDDTLNDFTATLRRTEFAPDATPALPPEVFADYLARVRSEAPDPGDLLATDYSFFKYRIHRRCYELARARADGVQFMRRLKADGWRIVICTRRDLRRANDCTRKWLEENGIPFDHLFMAWNKIAFCHLWGIRHLVDDDPFNLEHGSRHGVNVYYPRMKKHEALPPHGARGFSAFEEVERWIQG